MVFVSQCMRDWIENSSAVKIEIRCLILSGSSSTTVFGSSAGMWYFSLIRFTTSAAVALSAHLASMYTRAPAARRPQAGRAVGREQNT